MPVSSPSAQSKVSEKNCGKRKQKTKEVRNSENYQRQMKTLFKKVNRMVRIFGGDIAVHTRREGKQRLYTSCEDLSWPAGIKDVLVGLQIAAPALDFTDLDGPPLIRCLS